MPANALYTKYYNSLIGKTVERTCYDPSTDVYGLVFSDGTIAWVLCDEEGNGAGFLVICKK